MELLVLLTLILSLKTADAVVISAEHNLDRYLKDACMDGCGDKGSCHLRFSGIRPLRGSPPPLPP